MGITTRKTFEYANESFKNKGLILDDTKYVNKHHKMECHDDKGYKYQLSLDSVKDNRTKRFEPIGKFNPYFVENINNFIKINNGNAELLTNHYVKSDEKVELRCNCGETYKISVCHLLGEKKFICNKCAFSLSSQKQIEDGLKESHIIANSFGYEIVEYNKKNDIIVKDKDGYLYRTTIYNLENSKNIFNRFSKKNEFTVQNMLMYLKNNNIKIEMVDKTPRTIEVRVDYLEWHCVECGEIFKSSWSQVAYGNKRTALRHRCEKCSKIQSNLEYIVEQYLIEKNIEYIKQYKFDDCVNKRKLPFDFYMPKYNTLCEVNGAQHYYESDMFTQSLEERKYIDKIKRDYCLNNNIKFLEIPSWKITNNHEIKGYKIMIDNILN